MRVFLVAPLPPPYGGISNWTRLIKEYADKKDGDVKLEIINTSSKNALSDTRTLYDRIVKSAVIMIKKGVELKRKIRQQKPDVIHIVTSGQLSLYRDIYMLRIAKKFNIPAVYHIRFGRVPEIAKHNTKEWQRMKRAIELANTTIAIDKKTLKALVEYTDCNAVYIPNPIDIDSYGDITAGFSKTVTYLGFVQSTKGISELIEGWQQVAVKEADWTLNIIGGYSQQYYNILKAKYNFENINFLGHLAHNEAMELLSKSGIFILPSYTEGFPNVILEAMTFGKPIIATSVGAIPDMLSDDCGMVIEPKNSTAVSSALYQLITDEPLRHKLGQKGYQKVRNNYSLDNIFNEYLKTWQKAINKTE